MPNFFETTHQDKNSRARAGVIHTDHGDIETPVFMPVGTQGAVKTLDQQDLLNLDAPIILGNTYHLHLRPGENLIANQGGLHKFINWPRPILTDSGGFQVFSLGKNLSSRGAKRRGDPVVNNEIASSSQTIETPRNDRAQSDLVKIDEDGVTFRSHLDGSKHRFTPESAIKIQHKIGADIIMAFDECTPDEAPEKYVREALNRTHRWATRCLTEHQKFSPPYGGGAGGGVGYHQFLFGIIQGAKNKAMREESAKYISSLDFDGVAIGGESVGYNMEATKEILDWIYPLLPKNKPHYAMGVGLDPADLLEVVERGVDMFDCVAPTRLARHGMLFTSHPYGGGAGGGVGKNRINITNASFASDTSPIDPACGCSTCSPRRSPDGTKAGYYTRSYLHHLFAAGELTALRLATIHNVYFMLDLMKQTRQAILEDRFTEFKRKQG